MKKILFFILIANFLSAQNPDLLNTNWYISKIVGEQFSSDQYPPPMPFQQVTTFSATSPQISLSFFNSLTADLNYNGQNNFTVSNKTCTSGSYNTAVDQYFTFLCQFFNAPIIQYTIQTTGTQKNMVIYNAIFQEIHFTAGSLSTKDIEVSQVNLAPNPAENILQIQNSVLINSYQIIDKAGKLLEEKKNIKTKNLQIDIQNYQTGIYFIKLNNGKGIKFIKK